MIISPTFGSYCIHWGYCCFIVCNSFLSCFNKYKEGHRLTVCQTLNNWKLQKRIFVRLNKKLLRIRSSRSQIFHRESSKPCTRLLMTKLKVWIYFQCLLPAMCAHFSLSIWKTQFDIYLGQKRKPSVSISNVLMFLYYPNHSHQVADYYMSASLTSETNKNHCCLVCCSLFMSKATAELYTWGLFFFPKIFQSESGLHHLDRN